MSLSFDAMNLIQNAGILLSGLWPVLLLPVAFAMGAGLLAYIVSEVRKAVQK